MSRSNPRGTQAFLVYTCSLFLELQFFKKKLRTCKNRILQESLLFPFYHYMELNKNCLIVSVSTLQELEFFSYKILSYVCLNLINGYLESFSFHSISLWFSYYKIKRRLQTFFISFCNHWEGIDEQIFICNLKNFRNSFILFGNPENYERKCLWNPINEGL